MDHWKELAQEVVQCAKGDLSDQQVAYSIQFSQAISGTTQEDLYPRGYKKFSLITWLITA